MKVCVVSPDSFCHSEPDAEAVVVRIGRKVYKIVEGTHNALSVLDVTDESRELLTEEVKA